METLLLLGAAAAAATGATITTWMLKKTSLKTTKKMLEEVKRLAKEIDKKMFILRLWVESQEEIEIEDRLRLESFIHRISAFETKGATFTQAETKKELMSISEDITTFLEEKKWKEEVI